MEILRRSDVDSDITGRRVEFFTDENKLMSPYLQNAMVFVWSILMTAEEI